MFSSVLRKISKSLAVNCLFAPGLIFLGLQFPTLVMAEKAIIEKQAPIMEPLSFGSVLQVFAGLIAVLLLFGAVVYVLKRMGGFRSTRAGKLFVVDGLSVGTRDRVLLMQVGEKQILLGVSPSGIAPLHVFDEPVVDVEEGSSGGLDGLVKNGASGFSGILQKSLADRFRKQDGK